MPAAHANPDSDGQRTDGQASALSPASHSLSAPQAPLVMTNLKEQVAESLRAAILTGQLTPGHTYNAGELAEQYGASRTPVREALLELASKGLVEVIRGVGFQVASLSDDEMLQIMELRQVLESWAMRKIAGRLPPDTVRAARAMIDDIARAAADNDPVGYWLADRAFHSYLVAQAGNPRLDALLSELRDSQRTSVRAWVTASPDLHHRNRVHAAILDAVEAGDGPRAAELVFAHLAISDSDLAGGRGGHSADGAS